LNLNIILSLTFAGMLIAACGEKPQKYSLSNGTEVQVFPRGEHRYEIVDFDKLTHDERTEFYFVISGGCIIRHTTEMPISMFAFLDEKQIIERDCAIPSLSKPI